MVVLRQDTMSECDVAEYRTVDGQIEWTVGSVGSWDVFVAFEFCMASLEVGSGPIGFVAPSRFKTLDSQLVKSNMCPVATKFDEMCGF